MYHIKYFIDVVSEHAKEVGGFWPFFFGSWYQIVGIFVMAAFIGAVSGKNRQIVRRVAVTLVATAVMSMLRFFFVNGNFGTYDEEFIAISYVLTLFLASVACGEKSPFRALTYSLVAVNVNVVTYSVMNCFNAWVRPSRITEARIVPSVPQVVISSVAAAVILALATFVFRKYRTELERREKIALTVSLFVITAVTVISRRILVTNLTYVRYRVTTISTSRQTIVLCVLILGALLLLNVAVYVLFVRMSARQKEKAEQAVLAQKFIGQSAIIEEVSKQHEKVSKIRHDLLNTLGTVDGLIASGKTDEAREFIRSRTGVIAADVRTVNTDNEYVNSIISYKTSQAKEKGVDVSVYAAANIDFPDNADLCNLIGNMLDNGISAAEKCEREKNVRLDIRRDGQSWRISVLNSVTSPVLKSNPGLETTNPDKLSHGYGMKIIREIAEKYYGTTDWYDTDDGRFCCSAVLYPAKPF